MEEFLDRRGYPQEKYQTDRVKAGVTKFQALWRGYLYKKAYPLALAQRRATIWREFLAWCGSLPPQQFRSFPLFCKLKGIHTVYSGIQLGQYAAAAAAAPAATVAATTEEEEFRSFPLFCQLSRAATKFQALWRGYLYKQAYPIVLRAARATEAINLNARATLSTHNHCARIKANSERDDAEAEAMFYCHHKSRVGSNSAILFNRGRKSEAIYSCEIVAISGESNGVQVYVRFHYDQERRKYHWKRFKLLERECRSFMIERGIQLREFEGKIPTKLNFWNGRD
jgi:hypothetical protein